ncbi:MAG: hypothetical protein NTX55_01390, partial [Candidatus Parcubacteria bacterium]|nr:hypothetical protein [Candidatus Parcubacteria bacterium]
MANWSAEILQSAPAIGGTEFIDKKEEAMNTMSFVEWVCKITLVYGVIILVLLLIFRHQGKEWKRIRAELLRKEADRQRRKVLDRQENLGNRFCNALTRAVRENP